MNMNERERRVLVVLYYFRILPMKCMRQVSLGPSSTPTLERPSESLWRHNSERFRVLQSDEIEKKDI